MLSLFMTFQIKSTVVLYIYIMYTVYVHEYFINFVILYSFLNASTFIVPATSSTY